jgi:hypothetical protein
MPSLAWKAIRLVKLSDLKVAALQYATVTQWPVFPLYGIKDGVCECGNPSCTSQGKHPLTSDGFKSATTDLDQIERWWTDHPNANIGICTAHLAVIDVDSGRGGLESWASLVDEIGDLPVGPVALTGLRDGRRGEHHYFAAPDTPIKNSVDVLGPGIDLRAKGGYVVASPSMHQSGKRYEFLKGRGRLTQLPVLPTAIIDRLSRPERTTGATIPSGDYEKTLAGVTEGGRHDAATRLAGRYLGRGLGTDEVEQIMLDWNQRNAPPLLSSEVAKVVSDFAATRATGSPLEFPKATDWPKLSDDALTGVTGEVVDGLLPHTEASKAALLFTFLTVAGNTIGLRPHAMVEGSSRHRCNLFVALVGDTSKGRKGTSWSQVREVFKKAGWLPPTASGLVSGEGLIANVADDIVQMEEVDGKWEEKLLKKGVADKRLLLHVAELASPLKVMARPTNTLSDVLRESWDDGNLRTLAKNSPVTATDAHISVVAHVTRQELAHHITATDMANGFANRFLWALVDRSKELPDGGGEPNYERFVPLLRQSLDQASQIDLIRRDEAASGIWGTPNRQGLYSVLSAGKPGLSGAVINRAEAQVLRLSTLYAALDGSAVVKPVHLRSAVAVWEYAEASARIIFGRSIGDPHADRIREELLVKGRLTTTQVNDLFYGNLKTPQLRAAIERVVEEGFARVEKDTSTGGRPAYVLVSLEQGTS